MIQINNNIQEPYCSFEVSKLLKEKGFNVPTDYLITKGNEIPYCSILKGGTPDNPEWYLKKQINSHYSNISNHVSCPTHALASEWVRENFGIHISINLSSGNYIAWLRKEDLNQDVFQVCINNNKTGKDFAYEKFKKPEEATETALLYTLKNLI